MSMKYPWAVPGAKVAYIGPDRLALFIGGMLQDAVSPLSRDKVYTVREVVEWVHEPTGEIALELVEVPFGMFHIKLFKPLDKKDAEMFDEWLQDIPNELVDEWVKNKDRQPEKAL